MSVYSVSFLQDLKIISNPDPALKNSNFGCQSFQSALKPHRFRLVSVLKPFSDCIMTKIRNFIFAILVYCVPKPQLIVFYIFVMYICENAKSRKLRFHNQMNLIVKSKYPRGGI